MRVFVAGHRGLLGRALVRRLEAETRHEVLVAPRESVDLRDPAAVDAWLGRERPDFVFLAAARVGGITANRERPADFIRENLLLQSAVIDAAHRRDVGGLCFFGSSCMYPRDAPQPLREEALLTGPLEQTSAAYATAKLAGAEACRAYRAQYGRNYFTLVPATLYGPHDHFGTDRAHVVPALMERFHAAREANARSVIVLGSGNPLREFLFVDDAADAAILCMEHGAPPERIHAGSGEEIRIADLAERVRAVVGYRGAIELDRDAPDGAPRKLLDSSRLRALGWEPRTTLAIGLERTYDWYAKQIEGGC